MRLAAVAMPVKNPEDPDGQEGNYKNILNGLCQRITGQSMSKTDILYKTTKDGTSYQCTATLVCLSGQDATGEVLESEKAAEQSAALQAVQVIDDEISAMGYSIADRTLDIPDSVKAAAVRAGICSSEVEAQDVITDATVKAMLHAILTKILDKKLEKGDLDYTYTQNVAGLHVASLQMKAIKGALGKKKWQGDASPFKRDSQLDCAMKAMDTLLSDKVHGKVDLAGAVHIKTSAEKKGKDPKKALASAGGTSRGKNGKGKAKGAGKGKGKGKGMMDAMKGGAYMWVDPSDGHMWVDPQVAMMLMGGGMMPYGGCGGKGMPGGKFGGPYSFFGKGKGGGKRGKW